LGSLRIKLCILVVVLLVVTCTSLAVIATQHERSALEAEVEKRGRTLATSLAGAAKEPLLDVEQGGFGGELTLERLIEEVGEGNGVVAARLLGRQGKIVASLDEGERESEGLRLASGADGRAAEPRVVRRESRLLVAAPILYSSVLVGEAQVEFDLRVLVEPVVKSNTRQLTAVATAVSCMGSAVGIIFVTLLTRRAYPK
jgi:hypothetical protein